MAKIKAIVCGATGYSGLELLKILEHHKNVEVVALTSEARAGKSVKDEEPSLTAYYGFNYLSLNDESLYKSSDVAFLCLPHEPAANAAKMFLDKGIKVIDLSAAYRIKDLNVFEKAYKFAHPHPELVEEAVYGLCELYKDEIKKARLIANPGCYPTSVLIPMIPLLRGGIIKTESVIIDSKSGASGAGRTASTPRIYSEMNENFYAYGLGTHRHRPEIKQELSNAAGMTISTTFSPHILPIDRGILSTIYICTKSNIRNKVLDYIEDFYKDEPFVKVFKDTLPQLKWVANKNSVYIGAEYDEETGNLIVVSVIDNLVKGASGQAVQNMNLMFGLDVTEGLR